MTARSASRGYLKAQERHTEQKVKSLLYGNRRLGFDMSQSWNVALLTNTAFRRTVLMSSLASRTFRMHKEIGGIPRWKKFLGEFVGDE